MNRLREIQSIGVKFKETQAPASGSTARVYRMEPKPVNGVDINGGNVPTWVEEQGNSRNADLLCTLVPRIDVVQPKSNFSSTSINISKKHNYKTLKSIEESLNGDGILVIDFLNINKVESELINQEIKIIDNITFKIKREINNGFIIKNINVIDGEKNYNFKETVMSLNLNDFKGYFNDFKLKIISTYGDYNLNPFNKKSERLIMVIKKSQP